MTKLEEIVAYKRLELAQLKKRQPISRLEQALKSRPRVRNFRQAIHRPGVLSLIAEIKRSSPSAGPIRPQADAVETARIYEGAGAQALSVLTESKFFGGRLEDLSVVRSQVSLPVLRKDFLLEEYQVLEAAASGADAVLLIMAILDRSLIRRLLRLAQDIQLEVLVEVHTEPEIEEVLEAGAFVIGMNNRDLATMKVDLKTTQRLIQMIPSDRVIVSESGLHSRTDVEFVQKCGAHAVLIGEEFMKSDDIAAKVKELIGGCG